MTVAISRPSQPPRPLYAALTALMILLAGCASGPQVATTSVAATSGQSVDAIAALLNEGDVKAARKQIKSALKRDPTNPQLAVLNDSISRDPVELLGPKHYEYVAKQGDTMTALAQRFLGNRLLTYQLARYNGIEKPALLAAGQRLRIPGQPTPAPERTANPPPSKPSERAAPARPTATPVAPAAAAVRTDPAAARQLRTQGLAALNRGEVAKSVQLLRRASVQDPANAAIKADLARAERIASTVKTRR